MPRFNAAYVISFQFVLDFFAVDDATAITTADAVVQNIFNATLFTIMDRSVDVGSSVPLIGQDVSGNNYSFVYTLNIPVGDDSDSEYTQILAADAATCLTKINEASNRICSQTSMPVKLTYLQEI